MGRLCAFKDIGNWLQKRKLILSGTGMIQIRIFPKWKPVYYVVGNAKKPRRVSGGRKRRKNNKKSLKKCLTWPSGWYKIRDSFNCEAVQNTDACMLRLFNNSVCN